MNSQLKAILILFFSVFIIVGGVLALFWFSKNQNTLPIAAKINSCQWSVNNQNLVWQCQISNSGWRRWNNLKFQMSLWQSDNTWQPLFSTSTAALGSFRSQIFRSQNLLPTGVWRFRAAILDSQEKIITQTFKIVSQNFNTPALISDSNSALAATLAVFSSALKPSSLCDRHVCERACLTSLDPQDPSLFTTSTLPNLSPNAKLCAQTCSKNSCTFCLSDPCGPTQSAGETFCQNQDVYHHYTSYQCQNVAGANACLPQNNEQKIESCSIPKIGEWSDPYCRGNLLLKQRDVVDGYCLSGRCSFVNNLDEELIQTCDLVCQDDHCLENSVTSTQASSQQENLVPVEDFGTSSSHSVSGLKFSWPQILVIIVIMGALLYFISR